MNLVVTGSIGIDTVELPDGERRENVPGGSALYFAAAAAFYTRPGIVAVAGTDLPPEHQELIKSLPFDTTGLELREGKTFRWAGKYRENLDERDTLATELNVLGEEPPQVPAAYKEATHLFLANAPPGVQLSFLQQFPKCQLAVADTMDLWITSAKEELLQLLREVDGLVLNYEEAEQLTSKHNTVAAAKHLLELGPSFVVVKKGEHGCLFAIKEEEEKRERTEKKGESAWEGGGIHIGALPAYPAEKVIDPTGAGDSFAGGLMGFLAARNNNRVTPDVLKEALLHATVLASFTIEAFSLERLQHLKKEELDARIEKYRRMLLV